MISYLPSRVWPAARRTARYPQDGQNFASTGRLAPHRGQGDCADAISEHSRALSSRRFAAGASAPAASNGPVRLRLGGVLRRLAIKNLAIVEDVELEFRPG